MHHWVSWVTIGSSNGLSPIRCQTITWTNAALLSIELLEQSSVRFDRNFIIFIKKIHLKVSSAKMAAILSKGENSWKQSLQLMMKHSTHADVSQPFPYAIRWHFSYGMYCINVLRFWYSRHAIHSSTNLERDTMQYENDGSWCYRHIKQDIFYHFYHWSYRVHCSILIEYVFKFAYQGIWNVNRIISNIN